MLLCVCRLSKLAVSSFAHIKSLMEQGNKARHTAATEMNRESSRSHAVFTVTVTEATYFEATKTTGEKVWLGVHREKERERERDRQTDTHTHTHSHTLSLPLSLPHTHT